jgi:ribosomal protein S18 acetylase RimI-like enzyme
MDGYEFGLANYNEIPEIVSIYHSLIGTPGCTWSLDYPNEETAEDDIKNNWLYTLKMNDKIIAVASAGKFDDWEHLRQWKPNNPCELARIGVNSAFQKQGIGTIILQYVIKEMKEQGFGGMRFIVSKTNPAALALYDKNGFERCGEAIIFDIDWFCYQMVF